MTCPACGNTPEYCDTGYDNQGRLIRCDGEVITEGFISDFISDSTGTVVPIGLTPSSQSVPMRKQIVEYPEFMALAEFVATWVSTAKQAQLMALIAMFGAACYREGRADGLDFAASLIKPTRS